MILFRAWTTARIGPGTLPCHRQLQREISQVLSAPSNAHGVISSP